ncbi:hypothetical protein Tco_0705105 [Tanacetum coccineum]|uniref:Reverse transcriptase domain-containing protein n=1 Tax=Tanacetum coccineum TaxID=301880 RepID=A0ABQ4Y3M2_9ASTR
MWSKLTPLGLVKEKSMLELYHYDTRAKFSPNNGPCAVNAQTARGFTLERKKLRLQTGEAKPQVHNMFHVSNLKEAATPKEPLAVLSMELMRGLSSPWEREDQIQQEIPTDLFTRPHRRQSAASCALRTRLGLSGDVL